MDSKGLDETLRMRGMNLCILRMLEDSFSLGEANLPSFSTTFASALHVVYNTMCVLDLPSSSSFVCPSA